MALPKTRDGWAALAVFVALGALGAWQASNGQWIPVLAAALGAFGAGIGVAYKLGGKFTGIRPRSPIAEPPPPNKRPSASVVVAALLLLGAGWGSACHPLGPAKRTTYALHQAVQLTGDGLGRLALAEHEKCLKAHGARTEDYKRCVWAWYGHLDRWHSAGRLGTRAALTLMYGGVRVAAAAGKKDLDYMELGQPVACALLRTLRIFGHLLQDQGGGVLKLIAAFDPSACPVLATGPRAAGGAVVMGIGLAVELLALLKRTMVDPADELFKAVDAWLRAPPKDASDAALATIRDHLPRAPRAAPRP